MSMGLRSCLLLLFLCLHQQTRAAEGQPVPAKRYTVNLDDEPQDRWKHVVEEHAQELKELMKKLEATVPKVLVDLAMLVGTDVEKNVEYPYNMEMVGIATTVDLPVGLVLLGNMLYEVTAFNSSGSKVARHKACTSIVAEALDGTIYHGRNLDYGFMTESLRNLTIVVDFQKAGETVYTGTTYAGFVGLLTGQKPNSFTVTMDERDQGEWWMNALEALVAGTKGVTSFLIRNTFDNENMDFEGAVYNLAYSPVIAPSYIIVGGLHSSQGAVITRDRIADVDIWRIDASSSEDRWFLVETNYDHWVPPPPSDDRRDPAIKAMNESGRRNLGKDSLFKVLSTPPVLNSKTTFTVTMSASDPALYTTWVRHP